MTYHQYIMVRLSQPVIDAIAKATAKERKRHYSETKEREGPAEDEYILITKALKEYREEPNVIRLRNGEVLQVGLKKDEEDLEEYLKAASRMQEAEFYERLFAAERNPAEPEPGHDRCLVWEPDQHGSVGSYFKAGDILYQFEEKFRRIFPGTGHLLKIYHYNEISYEPRIKFPKKVLEESIKEILEIFPEFTLPEIEWPPTMESIEKEPYTPYRIQHMPRGLAYEDDYSWYEFVWYGDDGPTRIAPDPDPHEKFLLQKVPRRRKGSPKAHCPGTAQKEFFWKEERHNAMEEMRRKRAAITRR